MRGTVSRYGDVVNTEPGKVGRPRSEQARTAVLHAVDDLLLEVGYAAMTMKGIAERAGVGRQTVYRWWSTKAEILFEASVIDARQELASVARSDPAADLRAYLDALVEFLTRSPAGAAYRALLGEAQHDPDVARLVATEDVVARSAGAVLDRVIGRKWAAGERNRAIARLVGPMFFEVMSGRDPARLDARRLAATWLAEFSGAKR